MCWLVSKENIVLVSLLLAWDIFLSVSIVNFEQVNAGWVQETFPKTC